MDVVKGLYGFYGLEVRVQGLGIVPRPQIAENQMDRKRKVNGELGIGVTTSLWF